MSGLVVEGAQGLESLAVPNLIPTLESPLLPFASFGVLLAYIARKKKLVYVPFLCGRCQGIASALVVNRLPRTPPKTPMNAISVTVIAVAQIVVQRTFHPLDVLPPISSPDPLPPTAHFLTWL